MKQITIEEINSILDTELEDLDDQIDECKKELTDPAITLSHEELVYQEIDILEAQRDAFQRIKITFNDFEVKK